MAEPASDQLRKDIAKQLALNAAGVGAVLRLSEEGATVPFMARYRKEATGGMDETQIRAVLERAAMAHALEKRRAAVLASLEQRQLLTAELGQRIQAADSLNVLEELYSPFKSKRQTRADRARDQGLQGLADAMWERGSSDAVEVARKYVSDAKGVSDTDEALAGARDICAERLSTDVELRRRTRDLYWRHCRIVVKKTSKFKAAATKFDTQVGEIPRLESISSHRWLACKRGEAEGVLRLGFDFDADQLVQSTENRLGRVQHASWRRQTSLWIQDAFRRLLVPAAKSDAQRRLDEQAESTAIEVFATNLRQLLLAAPLGNKPVLGIDPGQRTGCKCVLVDGTGKLVAKDTIFLVQGDAKQAQAEKVVRQLAAKVPGAVIAIGNGTHGRETQQFVKGVFRGGSVPLCVSVNEAGASVYSASDVARREFPDLDVSYRGAVSIARRLQDPLAELVKIDPQSIGVGQYQHDIDTGKLRRRLAEVVESCVNSVGVDLNTASPELLSYVAGLGPTLAERIVQHRHEHGTFADRKRLLSVKGLGAKAFEQCAGFLRIRNGNDVLDNTGVHPERYGVVRAMAKTQGVGVAELVGNESLLSRLKLSEFADAELGVGEFTLKDIVLDLTRPGRDPRAAFEAPRFMEGVNTIEDVKPGMKLAGVVTNVAAFGAFVDVGVHQDGLIHVSKLAKHFVKDPNEVVRVGQGVEVEVLEVDLQRKRISLVRL